MTGIYLIEAQTVQCSFEGCTAATEKRHGDGWWEFWNCFGGFRDGWYCPTHSAMLEALHEGVDPDNPHEPT